RRLQRWTGDEQIALGLALDTEIATGHLDVDLFAGREAASARDGGIDAPVGARALRRPRGTHERNAVAADARLSRLRGGGVEHMHRERMVMHVEWNGVGEFVVAAEDA